MAQPGKKLGAEIRLFARASTSVKHSSPNQDLLIFHFAFRGWQSGTCQSRPHQLSQMQIQSSGFNGKTWFCQANSDF